MNAFQRSRFREIAPGVAVLLAVALVTCGAIYGWRLLPGLWGEWIGFMVGLLTTPFILEFSFIVFGLILVVSINHWRRKREGDDFVVLEQVSEKNLHLPDHARWAVYRHDPLPGEEPSLLVRVEGALAVDDFEAAAEHLAAMSPEELRQPEALRLRIDLARRTGNDALAAELAAALAAAESV